LPAALPPRPLTWLVIAGLAGLAGYLLGTPYTLLDTRRFLEDFGTQYRYGESRWLGQPLEPVPLLYLTSLLQGFGLIPCLLALAGAALAWRSNRKALVLLLSFPAIYLAFLMPKALFFPRFTIPLLPALALLASYGALELAGRIPCRWRRPGLALLLAAALAQPLANDLLHNRLLLQADTRILANEWVQANLPAGSRVKVEDYSLRDLSTQARTYTLNTAGLRIERFEGSPETESARAFFDKGVQYVVTSSFAFDRYLLDPPGQGQRESGQRYQRLHTSLERRTEEVARFAPGQGNTEVPYRLDDVMTPFWSLPSYERPGPTVRVYSLAPLAGEP
jgi:hypothetical protein